jgi:hypothetical protein
MANEPNQVLIRYMKGEYQFGRAILFAQLFSPIEDKVIIMHASLAQILMFVKEHKLVVTNAQDVLTTVIIENGFAS